MAIKSVYRIEHAVKGRGPYTGLSKTSRLITTIDGNCSVNRPNPSTDFNSIEVMKLRALRNCHYELYGFPSIYQLKKWFNAEDRENLRNSGFIVKQYYVPEEHILLSKSKKQVLFLGPSCSHKTIPK